MSVFPLTIHAGVLQDTTVSRRLVNETIFQRSNEPADKSTITSEHSPSMSSTGSRPAVTIEPCQSAARKKPVDAERFVCRQRGESCTESIDRVRDKRCKQIAPHPSFTKYEFMITHPRGARKVHRNHRPNRWWQSSIRSHWVKLLYTHFAGQGPGAGFMNRRRLCQLTAAILTSDLTTHMWVLWSDTATIL